MEHSDSKKALQDKREDNDDNRDIKKAMTGKKTDEQKEKSNLPRGSFFQQSIIIHQDTNICKTKQFNYIKTAYRIKSF